MPLICKFLSTCPIHQWIVEQVLAFSGVFLCGAMCVLGGWVGLVCNVSCVDIGFCFANCYGEGALFAGCVEFSVISLVLG